MDLGFATASPLERKAIMPPTPGKLVGIDLGTTFCAIATLDDRGQAITLPNREGEMLTPSAVLIDGDSAVIGQAARDVALEQPGNVAMLIKRYMGHPIFGQKVAGRDFRPETLSALILRKLVQDAELRIGPIRKAVITVPAYFDDTRRKATKDAGRIAGLEVHFLPVVRGDVLWQPPLLGNDEQGGHRNESRCP